MLSVFPNVSVNFASAKFESLSENLPPIEFTITLPEIPAKPKEALVITSFKEIVEFAATSTVFAIIEPLELLKSSALTALLITFTLMFAPAASKPLPVNIPIELLNFNSSVELTDNFPLDCIDLLPA